ncbi:MAG: hypothetical protein KA035_01475, partial [Candidatus Levybacteria bacterium]|nr:hypothetical protein [Candidatus Levybacteria bacterium]
VKVVKKTREETLPLYLYSLLLSSARLLEDIRTADIMLDSVELTNPACQKLFVLLKAFAESGGTVLEDFAKTLPSELVEVYDTAFIAPIPELDAKTLSSEIKKTAYEAKKMAIKNRLQAITVEIEAVEKTKDAANVSALQEEASLLTQKLYATS